MQEDGWRRPHPHAGGPHPGGEAHLKRLSPRSQESESCLHQGPQSAERAPGRPAPRISGFEGQHAEELEALGKVHIKYHILLDPARKQSFERSLDLIHLLIVESLLKRQETTGIPPKEKYYSGSHLWAPALPPGPQC